MVKNLICNCWEGAHLLRIKGLHRDPSYLSKGTSETIGGPPQPSWRSEHKANLFFQQKHKPNLWIRCFQDCHII
jgi:hypothetical protein